MKISRFLLIAVVSFISSCTSLSKDECRTIDWHHMGKYDGHKGKSPDLFSKYHQDCREHGLSADQKNYFQGRSEGLKLFCQYQSGYNYGKEGSRYLGVCPPELEADFLKGYQLGKKEYEIEQEKLELERREQEIKRKEEELREKELEIQAAAAEGECSFDSDCGFDGQCTFNRCEKRKECTFDSDCRSGSHGRCIFNECRYD